MSTKELPKEIQGRINSKYPYIPGDDRASVNWNERAEIARGAATAWARIAIGFAIWASENYWLKKLEHGTTWVQIIPDENREERARRLPKTTSDLLIEYIKTLPQ